MSEWQDISTAPKDGRVILFCPRRREIFIASWIGEPHNHWRDHGQSKPTHWQYLPEPPPVNGAVS